MPDLPAPIRDYVHEHAIRRLHAAYLGVATDGSLKSWGGDLERYGIEDLVAGQRASELAPFLEGILPLRGEPFLLPQAQTTPDRYADIHCFPGDGHDWVILLDCTDEARIRQLMQQRGNELALLRDLHSRILDQFLGKKVASDLAQGLLEFKEEGERRRITVLFADVRGSTTFAERQAPEIVFRTLNLYLRAMVHPILAQAGIVDKLIGDGVMAVFGLLSGAASPETLAVRAAAQMLEDMEPINRERYADGREVLQIGVGIATGPAVLGILGSKERRAFSAIGHHVNLAARLESEAGPREILIDENTHSALVDPVPSFSPRVLQLKGFDREVTAWASGRNS